MTSEDEWYKAAYHKNDGDTGNYFDYPTSNNAAPGRDMAEATNPGNNANYWDGDDTIGSPYWRTEVGEFEWVGFRVSEVPEPATMTLLALGGLGMAMRRRAPGR